MIAKRIAALLSAAAMTASLLSAVSVSAYDIGLELGGDFGEGVTSDSDNGTWIDLVACGFEPSSVSHLKLTIKTQYADFGGCIGFYDVLGGWQMDEDNYHFANAEAAEAGDAAIGAVGKAPVYTLDFDIPYGVFTNYAEYDPEEHFDSDSGDPLDYRAEIVIQQWWGDMTLLDLEITGDPLPSEGDKPYDPDDPYDPDEPYYPDAPEYDPYEDGIQYGDFYYRELEDGTLELSKYVGDDEELVIPTEINGKKVSTIGSYFFRGGLGVAELVIPEGVTAIADNAFDMCSGIEDVKLPSTLTSIGECAFYLNGITEIDIPDSVTYIGEAAFAYCLLEKIKLPAGLTEISDGLFYMDAYLEEVEIQNGVTRIGEDAFTAAVITNIVIPESVKIIAEGAFRGCPRLSEVTLSEGVEEIGDYAFLLAPIKEITIPSTVKYIGHGAFMSDPLDSKKAVVMDKITILAPDCVLAGRTEDQYGNILDKAIDAKYVFGYKGSTAEAFCKEFGRDDRLIFTDIEDDTHYPDIVISKKGDVNGDGVINISDLTAVTAHAKGIARLKDLSAADVNGDNSVNLVDVSMIAAHVKNVEKLP